MRAFKKFTAMFLVIILTVTCLPVFDGTPVKAATIPAEFQNAQLMSQNLSLRTDGLYRIEAENLPISSLINRLQNGGSSFVPEGTFKAYAVSKTSDGDWSSPVFCNTNTKINLVQANGGFESSGYYVNNENYLGYYKSYNCVKKIALVFGTSSSSTITSSDKVYVVNVGSIKTPALISRVYDQSGYEKTVTSATHPEESGKKTLLLRVNDDSWSENSSARVVFGLSKYEKYFPATGTVKVYRGYYQSVDEIPSNAEDITDKVWCGTSFDTKEGIPVYGSGRVPITIVMKQGDQVIEVIGRYVGIEKQQENIDRYRTCVYNGSDVYLEDVDKSYKYSSQNGEWVFNYTLTLAQEMLGKDKYYLQMGFQKGKIHGDKVIQYVDKIVEGFYKNKTEAQNVPDIKNSLLYRNDSTGFVMEFDKTYKFTVFFKNGTVDKATFTLKGPAGSTGPVINKQPVSAKVRAGESAAFSVKATGTGLKYLWQYLESGKTSWTDWTTKTTADINVAYAAYRNGMSLRCKITDSNGRSVISDIATLKYVSNNDIPINSTYFPDANFRKYVADEWDEDGDGYFSEEELNHVTWLECNEMNITSLKGIELFPNLYELCCSNNKISSIDISKNKNLFSLEIEGNPISSIDISNCPCLKEVFLDYEPWIYSSHIEYLDWEDDGDNYLSIPIGTHVILGGTGNVSIVKNPEDYSCDVGSMAVFDIGATGKNLKFQWMYKNKGDSSWTNWRGKTSSVISVAFADSRDGMSLRCMVTDANGNQVISKTAVLTYEYPFYIDHQPISGSSYVTVNANEAASLEITAVGNGLKYLWQYKEKGKDTWTDWPTKTTPKISIAYAPYRDGMSFRCKVTNFQGRVLYSREVMLKYESTFGITGQPVSTTVDAGSLAYFEVKAEGNGLKYLWQYKEAGKSTWVDWTSKTTAKISVAYAAYRDGMSLRCVVTDSTGNKLTSNAATLNYNLPLAITGHPVNTTVQENEIAYFEVKATGKGLKYLWQYKEAGKSTWTDWTSKTTSKISVAYAAYRDGMSLRCVVTDSLGNKITSNTATLKYFKSFFITGQPLSVTVDNGSMAYFEVKAQGTGIKYLWQYKLAGETKWTDWTTKTTSNISVAYAGYRNGMSLRCVLTDSSGNKLTSNAVTLNYK